MRCVTSGVRGSFSGGGGGGGGGGVFVSKNFEIFVDLFYF